MVVVVVDGAADEGGEALELVDEAVLHEEFERAVDGGGGCAATLAAQFFQQVVCADGAPGFKHEGQDLAPQLRQLCAAGFAEEAGAVELGGDGVWRMGFGVHSPYVWQ